MRLRKTFLSLLFFLFSLTLSAQYNTLNELYIGASGGATMSTITLVPKLVDKMFTFNNDYGLTLRYISEEHFGLQAEVNHYESGWKEDLAGNGLNYSYARKLSFIEIPFMLHAYTGDHSRFFLNVGPDISLYQSESEEYVDNSETFAQHGKKVEHTFQYGIVAGGGLEFHVWRSVIGLEGRYHYNLSNIYNDAVGDTFNTSSIQSISLNLYLLFQVGGHK